jgi:hypothetical protein
MRWVKNPARIFDQFALTGLFFTFSCYLSRANSVWNNSEGTTQIIAAAQR